MYILWHFSIIHVKTLSMQPVFLIFIAFIVIFHFNPIGLNNFLVCVFYAPYIRNVYLQKPKCQNQIILYNFSGILIFLYHFLSILVLFSLKNNQTVLIEVPNQFQVIFKDIYVVFDQLLCLLRILLYTYRCNEAAIIHLSAKTVQCLMLSCTVSRFYKCQNCSLSRSDSGKQYSI